MYRYLFLILFLFAEIAIAQTPRKPLSRKINRPDEDQMAPCLSGDGRTMIFMSTYSESREYEVKVSHLSGSGNWSDPEDIDVLNRWSNNNMDGGYFLSYDGNTIYFTSRKQPGIGRYDIWVTEKKGNTWSAPVNLGKPLNSELNEGAPSLSPDGKFLYFMRCEKMSKTVAENCKLFVAERRGNTWNEAVELPSVINNGHTASPRILGDDHTLVFSSDRPGGKGKLDYYISRKENGQWQKPEPMDYLNTPQDDQFVSIPLRGDIAYYAINFRGNSTIIKAQIPEDMQPKKVNFIEGTVTAMDAPVNVFLQLYDFETGKLLQSSRSGDDGKFKMIIPEGKNYDFSATPFNENLLYYAKIYELEEMERSNWEKAEIELQLMQKGVSWANRNIQFEDRTADLKSTSDFELKRLIKLMKNNPSIDLTMEVYMDEVIEDTIRSSPDLTEIRQDTITYEVDSIAVDTVFLETESVQLTDSMEVAQEDTLMSSDFMDLEPPELMDYRLDSTIYRVERKRVIDIFHNDRTYKQATALHDYFKSKGVPEDRIIVLGLGDINNIEKNDSEENRALNRRVEVRLE